MVGVGTKWEGQWLYRDTTRCQCSDARDTRNSRSVGCHKAPKLVISVAWTFSRWLSVRQGSFYDARLQNLNSQSRRCQVFVFHFRILKLQRGNTLQSGGAYILALIKSTTDLATRSNRDALIRFQIALWECKRVSRRLFEPLTIKIASQILQPSKHAPFSKPRCLFTQAIRKGVYFPGGKSICAQLGCSYIQVQPSFGHLPRSELACSSHHMNVHETVWVTWSRWCLYSVWVTNLCRIARDRRERLGCGAKMGK